MKGIIKKFQWSDYSTIKKETFLAASVMISVLVLFFKMRPYFEKKTEVHVYAASGAENHKIPKEAREKITEGLGTKTINTAAKSQNSSHFQEALKGGISVIERPLFDGVPVVVIARLTQPTSSLTQDAPVEAEIAKALPNKDSIEINLSPAEGARLLGRMTPNFATKTIAFSFSEMISREGKSYTVSGYAFDPETNGVGVTAHYASGLPSRLAGIALNRTITVGSQIGMANIIGSTTPDSPAQQELQRLAIETNQTASQSMADEATKDLRETPAELSLPAGTIIQVKLRSAGNGGAR